MILSYDIAVDLTPEFNRQLSPKFSVSLGDHGAREYTVRVLQGGEPYEIEEGSTVSIVGKKSDGHIFAYACTYADEYVYFTIEEQMTPVSGIVTCELSIIDASGNKVGSANFTYWVEPSPVTDGEASESDLQLFQQLLDAADDLDDVREILDRAVPIAEQLGDVEKLLTAFPTEEASGSLLTLTDGADGITAKKVTLSLSPHQSGSGDPSPDNVRPISGYESVTVTRTGKNILPFPYADGDGRTIAGVTYTVNADGSISISGTATTNTADFYLVGNRSTYSRFGVNGTVTVKLDNYTSGITLWVANENGETVATLNTPHTIEFDPDTKYRIFIRAANGVAVNATAYPMIYSTDFSDTYEKPTGHTDIDITFPTSAGTVYGGSLEINDDGSGTLTVDKAYQHITAADITRTGQYVASQSDSNTCYFNLRSVLTVQTLAQNDFTANDGVGDVLKCYPVLTLWNNKTIEGFTAQGYFVSVRVNTSRLASSDVSGLAAYFADGFHVVYTMLTPTAYTLTAEQVTTLLGDNTLWMDADGTIDLAYRADTTLYINNLITGIRSNLAYIEDGMTASRAYSVGQYVLISGQLYKVTASIASGATFTIGTNVVATTVGTELTALNN